MYYYTIKEIEKIAERNGIKIIGIYQENRWIVILPKTGIGIKIRSY